MVIGNPGNLAGQPLAERDRLPVGLFRERLATRGPEQESQIIENGSQLVAIIGNPGKVAGELLLAVSGTHEVTLGFAHTIGFLKEHAHVRLAACHVPAVARRHGIVGEFLQQGFDGLAVVWLGIGQAAGIGQKKAQVVEIAPPTCGDSRERTQWRWPGFAGFRRPGDRPVRPRALDAASEPAAWPEDIGSRPSLADPLEDRPGPPPAAREAEARFAAMLPPLENGSPS